MSEYSSEQEVNRWKQQYYDHLDLLDKKEKDWQALESTLKKAVLRLSIAAEGQHSTIDRHLQDIRSVVKGHVDTIRLDNILEDISAVLLKVGARQGKDKKVVSALARLLENIDFPAAASKQKKKLVKKLSGSTDKDSYELAEQVQELLSESVRQANKSGEEKSSSGLLKNLFGSQDNKRDDSSGDDVGRAQDDSVIRGVARLAKALPWPDALEQDVDKALSKLQASTFRDIDNDLDVLVSLVNQWKRHADSLEPVDDTVSFKDEGSQVRDTVQSADVTDVSSGDAGLVDEADEPSIQEILIRLLEQLMVSPDLVDEVESLKHRIQEKGSEADWKRLLRDVAHLINTLRSRMQEEKLEFETFLQQITGRLKEMDNFLALENASLDEAEQASEEFDVVVSTQVKDLHEDMTTANDLGELKTKVEKRLNVVSDHIKQYRSREQERYASAQQNLEDMQSRLVMLEQETGDLRQVILEKNREAMFDVLTEIPNRLSYEKKAAEEIARCKRFSSQLCMAVWDIDRFKQINDTYGHKVGDKVLKAIAQVLNDRIRETDFIARYGGEEFVMFLPGSEESEALQLADALREKVSSAKFKHFDEQITITVSCGISSYVENDTHESMFERADQALYAAKRNGRNQCLTSSSMSD